MSKIEELIKQYCPNGVKKARLGELGTFDNIGVDKKSLPNEKPVVLLNYMDVYKHKYIDSNIPQMVVTASNRKIETCTVEKGDIFITPTSETIDDIGHSAMITETIHNAVYSYHIMRYRLFDRNDTTCRYINYLFESDVIQKQIAKSAQGLTRFGVSKNKFADMQIPLPPFPIQEKITEILDKFSLLTAELEAELEAELDLQKKRYDYYRNRILSFDSEPSSNSVQWRPLGEVFEMRNGYTPAKSNDSFWTNGTIPWYRMEDIRENGRLLRDSIQHITPSAIKGKGLFKKDSIILATSATIGEHALLLTDALSNQRFTNLQIRKDYEKDLIHKYVFYYMFIVDDFCKQHTNISGFESVDMEALNSMPFPIPPLAEQERIVNILDRFEALVTNLSNGLPAEIERVRKQYEYYRNKLLTFPIAEQ